jgi:hypothetical protein
MQIFFGCKGDLVRIALLQSLSKFFIFDTMNKHFNQSERDVAKLAAFFKKESVRLMNAGTLSEDHKKVEDAVDNFLAHLDSHATARAFILEQREYLNKLVKDNAVCPKCNSGEKLKVVGTEKNNKGWKSNRYRCRKCNIAFTWNLPNNPWHMIEYIEDMIEQLRRKVRSDSLSDGAEDLSALQANLDKLKPVIEAHDKEYSVLQARETEMERLLHEFRNSLMIEKIKMDTWDNKQKFKTRR